MFNLKYDLQYFLGQESLSLVSTCHILLNKGAASIVLAVLNVMQVFKVRCWDQGYEGKGQVKIPSWNTLGYEPLCLFLLHNSTC